jgi:hypothetical protein
MNNASSEKREAFFRLVSVPTTSTNPQAMYAKGFIVVYQTTMLLGRLLIFPHRKLNLEWNRGSLAQGKLREASK